MENRRNVHLSGPGYIEALEVATLGDGVLVVYLEYDPVTCKRRVMSRFIDVDNEVKGAKPVSPDPDEEYSCPAVASCGDSFLVAFHHFIEDPVEGDEILKRGVKADGNPSDVWSYVGVDMDRPGLACDGQEFLLVYVVTTDMRVEGRHLHPDVMYPFLIYGNSTNGRPEVTYDATSDQFLTIFQEDRAGTAWLMARMCTLAEPLGDGKTDVQPDVVDDRFAASANELNNGVVWQQKEPPSSDYIAARRVNQSCALVGPIENVSGAGAVLRKDPHVAGFGEAFGVVWYAPDEQQMLHVWMDTVSSWQRHFYVRNLDALERNNGRHLALDPETGWLHRVYVQPGLAAAPIDSVLYTYSTDDGENWFPYEYLGPGRCPCVVCEDQENLPVWVCFVVDAEDTIDDTLKVLARHGEGDWKSFVIPFSGGVEGPGAPSMSMAYNEDNPKVYVACRMLVQGQHCIMFYPVRFTTGVGDSEVVHHGVDQHDVPSLATTPEDLVHCVWGEAFPGTDHVGHDVYYRERVGERWQELEVASDPDHHTCVDPSVDQDGDLVFVAYSAEIEPRDAMDVWYGERSVDSLGTWENWFNRSVSDTPMPPHSRFAQNSTKEATIWREYEDEIMLWLQGEKHLFRYTSFQDVAWPHMSVVLNDPGQPNGIIRVYATWVEKVHLQEYYRVPFACSLYHPVADGAHDHPFYEVVVGDSVPSRYCRSRDGYARWRGFSVDYARKNLSYRLRYLNPHCVYRLMAVLYQSRRGIWEQGFAIDGRSVCRARYRPETPETVLVTIPRDLYRRDFTVDLDIGRITGDYASVAELKLYEVYPFLEREGRDVILPVCEPAHRLLDVGGANPFHTQARIQYSVPSPQQVSVRVYDVQGRVVSELASGPHVSGEYTVCWTGTDDQGRQVAAGAYFVELKTESSETTRKLVYAP